MGMLPGQGAGGRAELKPGSLDLQFKRLRPLWGRRKEWTRAGPWLLGPKLSIGGEEALLSFWLSVLLPVITS